jgi:tetratricopeptide (TPR) repeat protein
MRRGLTRFVGRDLELQRLLSAWHQVQQGHGHVVSVVGEAGLGKSRLLYEFKRQLEQTGTRYVEGTCFTYGGSISYLPFLAVVRALCGLEEDGAEVEAKRLIAAHLATLGLAPTAVAPYLHNLLSFTVEDDLFPKLTADLIRQRTVEALKTLVVAEATRHPLALIFEDVRWIDKATEEVVSAVVDAIPTLPLLLVLVYRPEYLHAWAGHAYHARITLSGLHSHGGVDIVRAILTKPYAARVPLTPLSSAQSTVMAHGILGVTTLPSEVEQLIVHKTDGNPLFIEELLRSLLESRVLARTPEGYHLTRPVETLDLPTTVQGVLLARIDRLSSDLKDVLQVAAVIGRTFSYTLLAQVLQQGTTLEQELLELEDLEFIYTTSLTPEREYSFKHVLTQEAVYSTLLRPQREVYHEWVGEAVETLHSERLEESYEMLAYHYVRSGDRDKAVEYLDLANQKAAKANAMAEAYAYFTEAMQLLDTLPVTTYNQQRRIALLVNQGILMVLLGKLPEYYDLLIRYQAMAEGLNKPEILGVFHVRLGWCEWCFGAFDQAIPTLTQAAELCETAGNADEAGLAYVLWEWGRLYQGDYAPTLALRDRALQALEQRFHHRWYMWARAGAALAHAWSGRWEQAVAEAQQGLRVGEEFADPSVISFAAHVLSMVYTAQGDLSQALAYGELALQHAPTPGDQAWAQAVLAWVWCRTGKPQQGVEVLAQIIPTQRAVRQIYAEIFAPFLGEGYWRMGEYDKARQALEEHLALAERSGMKWHIGTAHRLLGEVALHTNPAAAPSHFEHSIAVLQQINAENELALAYAGYGRLHAQGGHLPQARTYLSQALNIFERLGTLAEPEKVRQALAALSED